MKFKFVIGLDMSKEFFNSALHDQFFDHQFDNDPKGVKAMLKSLKKLLGGDLSNCLFCLEHTGMYSVEISKQLAKRQLHFSLISPLEIKKSLGIQRGKSDPVDARRIAEYGMRYMDKIKLYTLPDKDISALQNLLSLRAQLVKTAASYKARFNEQKRILKLPKSHILFKTQQKLIHQLQNDITKIEVEIQKTINNNKSMKEYFDLITSIKGIGLIVASSIIVKTQCFTSFDNWRKFACYCGTAPFSHQSGKYHGKKRISKIGDQSLRTLLTLAARTAALYDPELKAYKQRKLDEGVPNKKITNMIRNKLLARIFSVAKRKSPYVILHKHAA
jgi:transposase